MKSNLNQLLKYMVLAFSLSAFAYAQDANTTAPNDPTVTQPGTVDNNGGIVTQPGVADSPNAHSGPKSEKRQDGVDQRQNNQDKRISNGLQSGQLSEKESAAIQKRQDHINQLEAQANADGKMTKKEKRKIGKAQDRASADIYKKKHNNWKSKK